MGKWEIFKWLADKFESKALGEEELSILQQGGFGGKGPVVRNFSRNIKEY